MRFLKVVCKVYRIFFTTKILYYYFNTTHKIKKYRTFNLTERAPCPSAFAMRLHILILSEYYIEYHHQGESLGESYSTKIAVLARLRCGDKLFHHHVEHGSCRECEQQRHCGDCVFEEEQGGCCGYRFYNS